MNAMIKSQFNSLRAELVSAIDSGYFSEKPADNYGITPATRLQWAIDSVDYIVGVGDSIPTADKEINDVLASIKDIDALNDDYVVTICGVIEILSKDQYVTEGKGNIQVAMDLLKEVPKPEAATVKRSVPADVADETDEESDESESLWDKAKKGFNKVKKQAAGKKNGAKKDTKKADYEKLKADYEKLKAEKADSDARADSADTRIGILMSNIRRLEEILDQNGIKH